MKPKRKAKAKPKPKPVEEESIKDIEETPEVSQKMKRDKAKYTREYKKIFRNRKSINTITQRIKKKKNWNRKILKVIFLGEYSKIDNLV